MRKDEKEEKQPMNWTLEDPKPPVIHSGHLENHVQHRENTENG